MATRVRRDGGRYVPFSGTGGARQQSAREVRDAEAPQERSTEVAPALAREFEAIYRREYPEALAYARRYVDRDVADDIVQAVFAGYWEGYAATPARVFGSDASHTQAAILVAVRNRLRSLRRDRVTRADKERHIRAELAAPIREVSAPDAPMAELELYEMVARALDALPARQREVFCLVRFDERSYEAAAAALEISAHTVHQHLVKASERMRVALAEYRDGGDGRAYEAYDEQVAVTTRESAE